MENFARQWGGTKELGINWGWGKDFLSKYVIKFATVGLVSKSPDNRYPMQAYLVFYMNNIWFGHATNLNILDGNHLK